MNHHPPKTLIARSRTPCTSCDLSVLRTALIASIKSHSTRTSFFCTARTAKLSAASAAFMRVCSIWSEKEEVLGTKSVGMYDARIFSNSSGVEVEEEVRRRSNRDFSAEYMDSRIFLLLGWCAMDFETIFRV